MGATPSFDKPAAVSSERRIGSYYACAGLAAVLGSLVFPPWSLPLLWPGAALWSVAAGYFRFGPRVYRKRKGRLPRLARLFFAPALLGQHLSLLHYRRQCRAWDHAAPGVLIGRQLSAAEASRAIAEENVAAVLDLTAEFSEAAPFLGLTYRNLPILDLTAPTPQQLDEAVAFLNAHTGADRTVYVHCKIGYSRSAAAIGAWLLASGRAASAEEAVTLLRAARPSLVVRPEALAALCAFQRRCREEKQPTAPAAGRTVQSPRPESERSAGPAHPGSSWSRWC